MSSLGSLSDAGDDRSTPFLLRLFYRSEGFHRLDEFASPSLPPYVPVYTGMDCTLDELALELAGAEPSALPTPAAGTRLAFQLVFPDLRNTTLGAHSSPRFAVKDLGSVVIGAGGPGAELTPAEEAAERKERAKTLRDAKFVVGDFISCAVLSPLSDGSVAPVTAAAVPGTRDGRGGMRGLGRGGHRGGFPSPNGVFGSGGRGGRQSRREAGAEGVPSGEWRRGDVLPEGPGSRGRSRW